MSAGLSPRARALVRHLRGHELRPLTYGTLARELARQGWTLDAYGRAFQELAEAGLLEFEGEWVSLADGWRPT